MLSAAPETKDILPVPIKADDDDEIVLDVSKGVSVVDTSYIEGTYHHVIGGDSRRARAP